MRRTSLAFFAVALLAVLLAGCGSEGYAGQDGAAERAGAGQAGAVPSAVPDLVDPAQQSGAGPVAGRTPSILGSTPQAGEVGVWERHRFFDVWDVGYPNGWTVDRPGTGSVLLSGAYGEHRYQVEVTRPTGIQAKSVADWAKADLEQIGQGGAPRAEAPLQTMPALKVTNLQLPGQDKEACPAVRSYARTDKLAGEQDYLMMTVMQTDTDECDPVNIERLADALIAEVRR